MSIQQLEVSNQLNIFVGTLDIVNEPPLNNSNTNFLCWGGATGICELNTTSPKGATGSQGATGATGATGAKGATGATGNANVTLPTVNGDLAYFTNTSGQLADTDYPLTNLATSSTSGNLVSYSNTSGAMDDSGVASSNIPLLNGTNSFTSKNSFLQLYGNTPTPTVVLGTGAGDGGASYAILGNDLCGEISITTSGVPAAGVSIIATITMSSPSTSRPQPIISLTGVSSTVASIPAVITAGFQSSDSWAIVNFGTSGLTTGLTYEWNYFVPSL